MKNYIAISLLACFLAIPAFGKRIPDKWAPGIIYVGDQALHGEVSYNPTLETVFCRVDGKIQAFTAHTVQFFEMHDQNAGITRAYSSLFKEGHPTSSDKVFYEVMTEGNLTLLRKGKPAIKPRPTGKYNRVHNRIADAKLKSDVIYSYYVYRGHEIKEIRQVRKQVLPLMQDQQEEMQQFIQNNSLDLNKPQGLVMLVQHYNLLQSEPGISETEFSPHNQN